MNAGKGLLFIVSLVLFFVLPGYAGQYTIFGPTVYERGTGKPAAESGIFTSPVTGPGFSVKIQNGGVQGNNRVSSGYITLNGFQIAGPSDFNHQVGTMERSISLNSTNDFSVLLKSAPGSYLTMSITGEDDTPPVVAITNPSNGAATFATSTDVYGTVNDDTPCKVVVNGIEATVNGGTFTASGIALSPGQNTITAVASDLGGNTTTSAITIIRNITVTVPNVVGMSQSAAESTITAANLQVGAITTTYSNTIPEGNVISQTPAPNELVNMGTSVALVVSNGPAPEVIPPDPATVAPPVDGTVATTVAASTEFLYTGSNPIQTGVAPGTIEARRAAVLKGLVSDRDGNPLSGVTVTVLNHPEFGQTMTRTDGMFDMAVNGGGILTVNYKKEGYMPVQRQVNAPWNDWAWLSDVVMLPLDSNVTTINLSSSAPIQVARGSVSTDADGSRQATLFFSQGTSARMVMPDGTTLPLASLNVRATEYTVGPNGPKAMPAELPPTSAYTYAVELSADEAVAAGATEVRFDKPVYFYVENFLNFPVGGIVPAGYYDYKKAAWIPSDNGRIIKILSVGGGLAELDTDGSGVAADVAKLVTLGISDAERQQLAGLYAPGQSLWRVPVTHFTPWDCNWPYGPPQGAVPPSQPEPDIFVPLDDPCTASGSIIECQNQTLGESLTVTGAPLSLNYRSDRVPGRTAANTIRIPLSGSSVPDSLKSITLEITIAGRRIERTFPPASNLSYVFTWDGMDSYGRRLNGSQTAKIRIGYKYGLVYLTPSAFDRAFAGFGGSPLAVERSDYTFVSWQESTRAVEFRDKVAMGLGAWSLNVHHGYDTVGKILLLGDGSRRSADSVGERIVTRVAGKSNYGYDGDGGPATSASLSSAWGVEVGPDGSIYIADAYNHRIRRVRPDGIITTVAGNGSEGYGGDGGPATSASLYYPSSVAVGPDGSIYFADIENYANGGRIRRVGPDGIINTVAGNGNFGYGGDGGVATSATLSRPSGVAVGSDGSIYIADNYSSRIRRVGPDGIINTVAGNGNFGYGGDGGPATSASLYWPSGVAVGPDGSIYFADVGNTYRDSRIRRIGPDGIITTVAGNGYRGYSGDGGPATSASLFTPGDVAIGADGSIYIVDSSNNRIRRVGPDGIITTVAGGGNYGGEGGPAANTLIVNPTRLAVGPDGSIFFAGNWNSNIRRVVSAWPGVSVAEIPIPSEDSSQLYVFNSSGKHLRTLNALTSATLFSFGYDTGGKLSSVTDGDGNITTIERDASGNPTAIVAPFGQRTALTVDSNGYINSITNPAGETYRMTYTTDGLLTTFVDLKGNASQFTYDESGLLTRDQNAVGGFSALFSTRSANSSLVTLNTALDRTTAYLTENLYNGQRRTITHPSGAKSVSFIGANGFTQSTSPDGMITTVTNTPDPRFGMQAPLESTTTKTPSGITAAFSLSRAVTLADPTNHLSLTSQTDTASLNGRKYSSVYTAAMKQRASTTPAGRQTLTLLDNLGRPLSFKPDPALTPVSFNYDTQGRLTLVSQGNLQSAYNYDSLGRLESQADAMGNKTLYAYNDADRVKRLTLPSGREYNFTYDANGNLTWITMPSGVAHNLGYSDINLGSDYTPPDNPAYNFSYSLDKEWTGTLLPGGRRIDAGYDNGGRPTVRMYPEAAIGYYYDDATDRIKRVVRTPSAGGTGQQIVFTYDGSLVTGRAFSGFANGQFTYSYNNDFLSNQIRLTSGTDSVVSPITRDADGLITGYGPFTFTRSGPAGATSQVFDAALNVAMTYDSLGRAATRTHTVNGQNIYSIQLDYDSRGNISGKTETVSGFQTTWDYTYDMDGQLTGVKKNGADAELYAYDVNGNRTSYEQPGAWRLLADFDSQDRLVRQGGTAYQFNADGQLIQRGSDTFQYSATGELLQATVDGQTITYSYDGMNRRVARTDNNGTTQYLYGDLNNPFQLTALRDPAGVLSYFYYDDGGLLFAFDKGGARYYVATDQVGTPKAVTDAAGTVVKAMEYDSFGGASVYSNSSFEMPVGFAGGIADAKTGLVRFGYRDYEAGTGRWTAKDPIFFAGGQGNLFGYVQNNPINYIDPDGLAGIPISAIKNALRNVYAKLGGKLPKGKPGKFDSPQCGTPKKGYRLDPGHPDRPVGDPEAGPHINYWDYTNGKRGSGGISGAEPIIGGLLGFLGSMLDPFDAISGELASDGSDMLLPGGMPPRR